MPGEIRSAVNANEFLNGSAMAGSPSNGPANPQAGEPNTGENVDYKALYEELNGKIGEQGKELGDYAKFFQDLSPLLDELDQNPELVQAIVDKKIDDTLITSVLEGKTDLQDAKKITKANEEVKSSLGKKYNDLNSEELEKLIEEKVSGVKTVVDKQLKEAAELNVYKEEVEDFIEKTKDFPIYAEDIDTWLDEHPNITDISVAYYAVKGKLSEQEASEKSNEAVVEESKRMAMNASGGYSSSSGVIKNPNLVDELIKGGENPNRFF